MPIAQFEGKALVFNNGVVDVVQGETSLVDENKVAHIPEGNVLIDNETIIKNANNQLEIPIDEDTIYIDEHGFMKAKGGNSEWSPIELSSEGALYFNEDGLAIKTSDSLKIVDNMIEVSVPVPQLPQDSEGEYVLSFKNGILSWTDPNDYFQWKMVDRTLFLFYGKSQSGYTKYEADAFAGLAPNLIRFDPTSPVRVIPDAIDAEGIFSGLDSFDLTVNLDTSKMTSLKGMFKNCPHLWQLDISSFNTANVTVMDEMFYNCSALKNIKVSDQFVTDSMNTSENMFYNCVKLPNFDSSTIDASNAYVGGYFVDYTRMILTPTNNINRGVLFDDDSNKTLADGGYIWSGIPDKYGNEMGFDDAGGMFGTSTFPYVLKLDPVSDKYYICKYNSNEDQYDINDYVMESSLTDREFMGPVDGYDPDSPEEYDLKWWSGYDEYESTPIYNTDYVKWYVTTDSEGYYIIESAQFRGSYVVGGSDDGNIRLSRTPHRWTLFA